MSKDGITMNLDSAALKNVAKQLKKLKGKSSEAATYGMSKFMQNVSNLAKNKLTSDKHVDTSRLKNSIAVQSNKGADESSYTDDEGRSYSKGLNVRLNDTEIAVGTNVEYAAKIEYRYDSFLNFAFKTADVNELSQETAKKLKLI